jgi:hypothetical protein
VARAAPRCRGGPRFWGLGKAQAAFKAAPKFGAAAELWRLLAVPLGGGVLALCAVGECFFSKKMAAKGDKGRATGWRPKTFCF